MKKTTSQKYITKGEVVDKNVNSYYKRCAWWNIRWKSIKQNQLRNKCQMLLWNFLNSTRMGKTKKKAASDDYPMIQIYRWKVSHYPRGLWLSPCMCLQEWRNFRISHLHPWAFSVQQKPYSSLELHLHFSSHLSKESQHCCRVNPNTKKQQRVQGIIGRQQNYGQISHQPQFAKGIFPPETMAASALSKYNEILL